MCKDRETRPADRDASSMPWFLSCFVNMLEWMSGSLSQVPWADIFIPKVGRYFKISVERNQSGFQMYFDAVAYQGGKLKIHQCYWILLNHGSLHPNIFIIPNIHPYPSTAQLWSTEPYTSVIHTHPMLQHLLPSRYLIRMSLLE